MWTGEPESSVEHTTYVAGITWCYEFHLCELTSLLPHRPGVVCFEERIEHCCSALREELRQLNQEAENKVRSQLELAVRNLSANIRYQFLEPHGPCRERVTVDEPLVPR